MARNPIVSPTPSKPPIVVKIGGSTLGASDTSLRDLAALHAAARPVAIVHGGGNLISEWMRRQKPRPHLRQRTPRHRRPLPGHRRRRPRRPGQQAADRPYAKPRRPPPSASAEPTAASSRPASPTPNWAMSAKSPPSTPPLSRAILAAGYIPMIFPPRYRHCPGHRPRRPTLECQWRHRRRRSCPGLARPPGHLPHRRPRRNGHWRPRPSPASTPAAPTPCATLASPAAV